MVGMDPECLLAVDSPGTAWFSAAAAGLSDEEVEDGLRSLQRLACRVEARRDELIGEAYRRGIPGRRGFGTATAWLMALSGDPAAVCRSRLGVATSLQEMPETRAAFAAAVMSESRVRLLAEAQERFARDEALLVSQAASVSSQSLPQVLGKWRLATDPQGAEADTDRVSARLRGSVGSGGLTGLAGMLV